MLTPKEQCVLASAGGRLLHSPRSSRRKLTVTPEEKTAATRQTIPIDRLLAEYGKCHLQLTVAEETIGRQQGQIAALSKQLQDSLKRSSEIADKLLQIDKHFIELQIAAYDSPEWRSALHRINDLIAPKKPEPTKINEIKLPANAQEAKPEEARTAQDG